MSGSASTLDLTGIQMETDDNFKELTAAVDAADKKRRERLAQDNSDRSNVELVINTRLDDVIVERDASKGCIQQHNTLDQHAPFWRPAIQRYGAWCTACFLFCAVHSLSFTPRFQSI